MIKKSKCFKISLIALLLLTTLNDGMQVMASTIRNNKENVVDVQTDSNSRNHTSEQNQDHVVKDDNAKAEEKQQSTDTTEFDESNVSVEPKQEAIESEIEKQKKEEDQINETQISTQENLGNEPPVSTITESLKSTTSGTLDWTTLDVTYRVKVQGSSMDYAVGVWFTLDGKDVFCIEGKVEALKNEGYVIDNEFLNEQQRHDINKLTYFGFTTQPHDQVHYMATQIMIWQYLGETVIFPSKDWENQYLNIKRDVVEDIKMFEKRSSFDGKTIKLYGIGETYAQTLKDENGYLYYCDGYSNQSDNLLSTRIENTLKIWATEYSNTLLNPLFVTYGWNDDKFSGEPVIMKGSSGSQRVITAEDFYDPGYTSVNVEFDINAPVKITKKDAISGEVIKQAGITYDIYNPDGTYATTAVSGNDGVATSVELGYGLNYYYIERQAPSNYQLNTQPVYFNIEVDSSIEGHEYVSSEITDQRVTGKIIINKEDEETGKTAQGDATLDKAVYGLYAGKNIVSPDTGKVVYAKDTLIKELTIENLQATADGLYLGEYYIKEIKAPKGYNLSDKVYPVTLSYKDQTTPVVEASIVVTDKVIKAPLEITKKDVDTGNAIKRAGAEFDVYTNKNVKIGTITTNANGVATLPDIPYGFGYYFVETKAPLNYTINKNKVTFDVTEQGVTVKKSISNKRVTGTLNLTKLDADYGKYNQGDASLENTIYGLYAKADIITPDTLEVKYKKDALVTKLTIHDFKATATNLYLGSYYIKEITPGKGYLLSDKATDVTFTYSNQNISIEIRNPEATDQVMKQAFRIAKFSSDGDAGPTPALKDAEFTYILNRYVTQYGSFDKALAVAKANDGRIKPSEWGVMTTDEQGMATSKKLPYGKYLVHETKVPANVEASSDFYVTIEKDSNTPQNWVYVNDPLFKTVLAVVKLDAETGNSVKLPDTTFKIKCLSDNADFKAGEYVGWWVWSPLPHYQDTFSTTEDGSFMTPYPLNPGTYQLEEISAPNGYLINKTSKPFTIKQNDIHQQVGPDNSTIVTTVTFSDYAVKGQVKVDKQAEIFKGYDFRETEYGKLYEPIYETGMLPNVKFEIKAKTDIVGKDGTVWYKAGNVVETLTTDGKNITTSSMLPIGEENLYTLQEVATEEGYVLDDTIYTFRFDYVDDQTKVVSPTWLDEDGNEIETEEVRTLENEKQVSLALANKQMEQSDITDTSESYKDVVFGFYSDEVKGLEKDSLVGISEVNEAGDLGVNITQKGSYYLKEIVTDPLYVQDQTKYPFTFAYNGDRLTKIQINDGNIIYNYLQRGSIEILKSDQLTGKPLVNVPFELATDKDFKDIIKSNEVSETLVDAIRYDGYFIGFTRLCNITEYMLIKI